MSKRHQQTVNNYLGRRVDRLEDCLSRAADGDTLSDSGVLFGINKRFAELKEELRDTKAKVDIQTNLVDLSIDAEALLTKQMRAMTDGQIDRDQLQNKIRETAEGFQAWLRARDSTKKEVPDDLEVAFLMMQFKDLWDAMGGVFKQFDTVVHLFTNHSANFGKMEAMQRDIAEMKVR